MEQVNTGLIVRNTLMHIFNSAASKNELVDGRGLSAGDIIVAAFDEGGGQTDYILFMVKEVLPTRVNLILIGEDDCFHDDGYSSQFEEKVAVLYKNNQ